MIILTFLTYSLIWYHGVNIVTNNFLFVSVYVESTSQELQLDDNNTLLHVGPANIAFEVVNAQVIKDPHDKYVVSVAKRW